MGVKPLFSVVVIARNEQATLPRLIASLSSFRERGGEIVVLDTGSTDETAEVARSAGCKVEEVGDRFRRKISAEEADGMNELLAPGDEKIAIAGDTLFDFSAARNYAAALASNDMIAMPDCDEVYTALDLDTLNVAITLGIGQFEYNFVFAHDEHGNDLVKFMHSKFYDRRHMRWVGIIHEVLHGTVDRRFFDENIIKLEHWQNPDTNRGGYLKGLALDVLENPENDRNAHYFGRELLYTGRPRSAIKQLKRHVDMKKWPEERSQSLVHIGEAYMQLGETPAAIHSWIDAFDVSRRREPLLKIAEYYSGAGAPDRCIAYASAALTVPENGFYATFQPYYENLPHELLYLSYQKLGDQHQAKEHYWQALRMKPFNSKYLHDMRFFRDLPKISIIIPTLRPEGLERTLASIEALNYPPELVETIVLRDEPRLGVPRRVLEGVNQATGSWIVYAADDMEFEPDCLIAALQTSSRNGDKGLIAFNSGPVSPDKGNICEHFMIYAELARDPAYFPRGIFDTDFHHVGVDNLLWATMEKAGEAIRAEHAKVVHHHFSRGAAMDGVYRQAWDPELVAADRALLEKKLAEL